MRRIVHVDPAGPQIQVGAEADDFFQRCDLTRNHDRKGAIDGGDAESIAVGRQQFSRTLGAARDGKHAAGVSQRPQQLAAQRHHARGIAQRKRTGDICRGDLPLRVPDHRVRIDSDRLPQFGQRHHHREEHRLHHVDAIHARRCGCATQHGNQRPVDELGERLCAHLDLLGEYRCSIE
ncbi:hypothetical protein MmonteBS_36320 [Mycobacterium montefiorense]|uniref:Uncharacterized protein n=1 Tax=Mycobacterium montefiorense TaxID=154654 RepID=A0ABQ0NQV0_9MYCO|nr:hypothetical protein MmonteBS_36320 [Mycobacterium montefiorense]GKU45624.1 hypothetical protein NJB14194_22450 [Mycobacterium montefiorense]